MIREHFEFRETITTILADSPEFVQEAKKGLIEAREELEDYIFQDPFFQTTYEPLSVSNNAPLVVKRMSEASIEANVGPMASVAATIAWSGIEKMQEAGAEFGLIDNGGDIVLFSNRNVNVGIYAGNAESSGKYAFVIPPQKEILSVCTSSATVGASVSFGSADAVVCFSRNPSKADAWATSLCNVINPENFESVNVSQSIFGIYAVIGNWIGKRGSLFKIVPADVDSNLITKGEV